MTVTAANQHDIPQAAALIREDDEVVYGDSGYLGIQKRPEVMNVEHAFRIIKCQFGCKKTVYRGLKKNENRLYALFAYANVYSLAITGRKLFTT